MKTILALIIGLTLIAKAGTDYQTYQKQEADRIWLQQLDSLQAKEAVLMEQLWEALDRVDSMKCEEEEKYLAWPCNGCVRTSKFGMRKGKPHLGIDLDIVGLNLNSQYVQAVATGVVTHDTVSGYGLLAKVRHSSSFETRYAHLSGFTTKDSVVVQKGEIIGLMGNTGGSRGKHLHYETLIDGKQVNPLSLRVGEYIEFEPYAEKYLDVVRRHARYASHQTQDTQLSAEHR